MHWAAKTGNIQQIQLWLSTDNNVNAKDRNGRVPLHYAAQEGHEEAVEFLITSGADVNAIIDEGD